jgi:hypothetical protein
MDTIDWVRLCLLNQLVDFSSPAHRLIDHPGDGDRAPYWAFPGRAALHASKEERINCLCSCVEEGLIQVYPHSCFHDRRFDTRYPLTARECHFYDAQFAKESEAVLTSVGYKKWQAEFEPDWGRFWMQIEGSEYDERTSEETLSIVYSTNEILDELTRWLASYWGLDKEAGLTELRCRTEFRYPATLWTILPCVKITTWKGLREDATYRRLAQGLKPSGRAPGETEQEARAKFERYSEIWCAERKARNLEREQAIRILSRLSKKWDCLWEPEGNRFDADPEPRVGT